LGRAPKFAREDLLQAAVADLAGGGTARIEAIAAAVGAPVGSIYHRFTSREQLLAEAWLLAVRHFQAAFLPPLQAARSAEEGVAAALAVPRWSRAHPQLAALLISRRQSDFFGAEVPVALRRDATRLNDTVVREIRAFARRAERSRLQCRIALVGVPYGAVRTFLPDQRVPREVDDMIAAAYRAVMMPAG
jgi:AcrR family transcriptional regulator